MSTEFPVSPGQPFIKMLAVSSRAHQTLSHLDYRFYRFAHSNSGVHMLHIILSIQGNYALVLRTLR